MVHICRLFVVMGMLMFLSVQFASSQHWSHGWYPGGKREIDVYDPSEVSEEIKLCNAGKCSFLIPQGRNILKTILLDALTRDFQKRK
ncbi:progonadoliberin IIB [Carassius auratus]|uniref:Progonadoliberin IIB n=2 Tax=Carassius auratus TaxID=7957 RepID=GON2B_CARAU|nr:progonadoliberin IIB [Carassius auratus]O42471.1 RecName: Full=Progonadoliberin IIB; Contains: RecName: Full=Gonadoliberin II; AltName: Full=Gonadotropin-releasing hormone II; Short=GnRH II; AltName: Full=Luliberin II; AltName: Full=Luteinizing hormone-releasing hormone II; Short=LH-RH II; Contains: RecName: Full=GnRH-associated peptide IIB; Flags: Precursor [Carassius auratus]AAB86989.1 gonadotropin-releasing hormone-II precursor [Carassius auratus]